MKDQKQKIRKNLRNKAKKFCLFSFYVVSIILLSSLAYAQVCDPRIASCLSTKSLTFNDTASITLNARISNTDNIVDSYIEPYKINTSRGVKFGYKFTIPNGTTGRNISKGLESVTFVIDSPKALVQMGDNAVGYWLEPSGGTGVIEMFKYDFSDILNQFTINTTGLVRELDRNGKWTGRLIDGNIKVPLPHTIEIINDNAYLTFDLRNFTFSEGETIDFDPIAQAGSNQEFSISTANTGTASSTITVPSDAEIAVVGISGYKFENNYFSGGGMTLTKGGGDSAMTSATGVDTFNFYMPAMYYIVSPDTGTNKVLKWDWQGTGTASNAPLLSITYWKGIDTSTPVRDSDGAQAGSLPYTTPTLTAQSGDLIVAWAAGYTTSEGTINSWSNLVELTETSRNGNSDGAWATGTPSGNVAVAASTTTNFQDGGIIAIVLEPSAADTTAPTFTSAPTNITTTNETVYITWTLDEAGNESNNSLTLNNYVGTLIFNSSNATSVTEHGLVIEGLSNGTKYYFNTTTFDSSGNVNSANFSFTTDLNEAAAADSCSCPGIDTNYIIDLSDNCNIVVDCDIGTGLLNWTGSGSCVINSTITAAEVGYPPSGQIVTIGELGYINITT